jgi:hypothetical protein
MKRNILYINTTSISVSANSKESYKTLQNDKEMNPATKLKN